MIDLTTTTAADTVQGTLDWHRKRLGCFSASRVADLMTSGRKKDETFGKTALTYITEVAAERALSRAVVDDEELLEMMLDLTSPENRYMRYGHDYEHEARDIYALRHGVEVTQTGSVMHPDVPHFSCSPDGIVAAEDAAIEIKCPLPKTYFTYHRDVRDAATLKEAEPRYYWQVQAQMAVLDIGHVDFIAYCPFMEHPYHEARIVRDDDAIAEIINRIQTANELIEQWTSKQ